MDTIPPASNHQSAIKNHQSMRPWRCRPRTGHIIGYVTRQHGMAAVLLIYPPGDAASIRPMAIIDGHAVLPCPVCACERAWYPGEESIRAMLERAGIAPPDEPLSEQGKIEP